jgi:hypothetical protein
MGIVREPSGRGTSAVGSRYRETANEDVTMDTSVCVIVTCNVYTFAVSKSPSPINPIINPKPVYSHSIHVTIL